VSPNEDRTLTQLQADVVSDVLLDGVVGDRPEFGIRPSVVVTVPALSLLGHKGRNGKADLPILEGYGPVDLDTATRLAGAARSWLRVLTHPETGVMLSVSRDIDHTQEWQHGGQTAHDNLAHLCQMHHDEKHHTAVTITHLPGGDIQWTMPAAAPTSANPKTGSSPPTTSDTTLDN
jgi:hypothetical protein